MKRLGLVASAENKRCKSGLLAYLLAHRPDLFDWSMARLAQVHAGAAVEDEAMLRLPPWRKSEREKRKALAACATLVRQSPPGSVHENMHDRRRQRKEH